MTENLAAYIDRARLNLQEAWTHENFLGESEKSELSSFKCVLTSRIDVFVRTELFPRAKWFWRPSGCSVQFMVEQRDFRLVQHGEEDIHLIRDRHEKLESLLVLSNKDQYFQDQLLTAIGDDLQLD